MRNLVPILFVALAFGAITCKKFTIELERPGSSLKPIPNRYVVFLSPSYVQPLVDDTLVYKALPDSVYAARARPSKKGSGSFEQHHLTWIPHIFMLM